MTNDAQQRISVQPAPLKNLVVSVEKGEYRIPRFQRDFVWEQSKVVKLFDSIYQEYPIGSFFLWKAGRTQNRLFRHAIHSDIPDVKDDDDVFFILDGQQRITSLYVALKGLTVREVDYSRICFDCQSEQFTNRTPDGKRYISVSEIWGSNAMRLVRQLPEEYGDTFMRCWERLQTYPVSLVTVSDKDLEAVCQIFQRINQAGKRLDRFDLISAMTYDPEFDLRERFQKDIAEKLESQAFGPISPTIVTQLIALSRKGSCTDKMQYGLTATDIRDSWKDTVDSILLAVATLRSQFGVKKSGYLPYEALLTLLSYYFCRSPHRAVEASHADWIRFWFWRSCFSQQYGGGGATRIGRDKELFDQLLSGQSPQFDPTISLTIEDLISTRMTWSGSAIRNAFLCLLAVNEPLHFLNNGKIDLVNGGITGFTSPEKHHIFPQAFLADSTGGSDTHALPNFCFVPAELNKRITDSTPSEYFAAFRSENKNIDLALRSHLIPEDEDAGIGENDYLKFLRARGQLILDEIQRLCGVSLTPRADQRQQVVEKAERRIRDFIHHVLTEAKGPDYWSLAIPGDVQEAIKNKAKQDVHSLRDRLDFCDVSDYEKIITMKVNWESFQTFLHRRPDVERHCQAFREYRNCIMHGRELSDLVRIGGEYALVWLQTVLPEDEPLETEQNAE